MCFYSLDLTLRLNDLKQLKKSFNLAAFAASFDAPTFLTRVFEAKRGLLTNQKLQKRSLYNYS